MSNVQVQLGGNRVQVQVQSNGIARANAAVTAAAASATAAAADAASAAAILAAAALKDNNLSDLASAPAALTNLGGTTVGKSIFTAADAAAARTAAGVVIGTDVQAYDADLTTWAGITPGTGVGAALAVNVGSAGAFTTFNGAGGTPSSMTLTNATGLPVAGITSSTTQALGVGSLELGHASDTTLARSSAGNVTIEGNLVYREGGTDIPITDGGTGSSTAADARTALAVVGTTELAASGGSALFGFLQAGTGASARTGQAKLRDIVSVKDFGAVGDGTTNDSPAFLAAVAALPAWGGMIYLPDAIGYVLDTAIPTGTKRVAWRAGACTITLPRGAHGFRLQSNGSSFRAVGRGATIFEHRAPVTPMVRPTLTAVLTAGSVSSVTATGGSGMLSPPVLFASNSPGSAVAARPDAGVVAKLNGDTITQVTVPGGSGVSGGTGYVTAPTITQWGGGPAAVVIEGVQGCSVGDLTVKHSNVPGSVGVLHIGGWWCDVSNIEDWYDVATGLDDTSSTSVGLLSVSVDGSVPGPTGAYDANYVCSYRRLHVKRAAVVGHGSSTATTINFQDCDIKNLALHACVGVTLQNHVCQPPLGTVGIDMLNVAGVGWFGGDLEAAGTGLRHVGSCTHMHIHAVVNEGLTGAVNRGQPGSGSTFHFANSRGEPPILYGSGGQAGQDYRGTGWSYSHGQGIDGGGDVFTMARSNLRVTASNQGVLDDTSVGGFAITISVNGVMRLLAATAGANPRTLTQVGLWSGDQIEVGGGGLFVAGTQVVKSRQPALPAAATDLASVITLANALRTKTTVGGAGAHPLFEA